MNELPPTLRALASVVQPLLSTASAVVGLGALAYLIGWRETQSFLGTLGAPWVGGLLGPTRMMQASSWVLWITLTLLLSSIYSIAEGGATHRGFRRWAIALLAAGIAFEIIDSVPMDYLTPKSSAALLGLGALCFAASAGLTFAEVVARYKEDGFRWHSYYLWLFFFVVMLTFSWAPSRMGQARAKLAMQPESTTLPKVELSTPDTSVAWRLLEVTDSSAVLVALGEAPSQNRFRVVPHAEVKSVGSAHSVK